MRIIKQGMRTTVLIAGSLLLAIGYPLTAVADDTPAVSIPTPQSAAPTSSSTSTMTPEAVAPTVPTSAPPSTSSPPASSTTSAPPKPTYTYDANTGRWNSDAWHYDSASGTYKPVVTVVTPPSTSTTSDSSASSTLPTTQSSVSSTTTSAIATALDSAATSGDASVLHNGTAGSGTSGDASSTATIVNNVNSSLSNANNQQAASFVSNVMGDVNGDIILQPMLLKAMLEAGAANQSTSSSSTTSGVTNNVNLSATSGAATVAGNTNAGSATSGSADSVANVVNIVNSMIAANQSFVGTINIYGNLNGDILIAPDFIPQLLASNAANGSVPIGGSTSATSNDTQSIVNNVALAASTGQALVSGNTSAGNATTGNAATNTVIFNLTGHEVVASNSLLVFINVLGSWVGVIVDAPAGATAAALGNGVTNNTVTPSMSIDATNAALLTNTITLNAQSGDANVLHNTSAGNATSGNATASANIANISGSTIGLSGWFGVLFINVFGSWEGSFGIDTSAGSTPTVTHLQPTTAAVSEGRAGALKVLDFIPHASHPSVPLTVVHGASVTTTATPTSDQAVLGAHAPSKPMTQKAPNTPPITPFNLPLLISSILLIGGALVGLQKLS